MRAQSRATENWTRTWGDRGSAVQAALGSVAGLGKLLLGSCVLLFFALYTPGSPPSSGAHWSVKQSKLQSSHSLTASSKPRQAGGQARQGGSKRLLPKFSMSKTTPEKYCLRPPGSHVLWRILSHRNNNLKKFVLFLHMIYVFSCLCVLVRRGACKIHLIWTNSLDINLFN